MRHQSGHDLSPLTLEVRVNGVHKSFSHQVVLAFLHVARALSEDREVLGEVSGFHSADHGALQGLAEQGEFLVVVKLGAVFKTTGPREDTSDGVGRSRASLLPYAVMTRHGTVRSLSLHDAVLVDADGGHESEGAEALSDNVGLDIAIVVLAGPHNAALTLDDLGNHVVNKTVLVVNTLGLHLVDVVVLVLFLEDVNEQTVVLLQDGVLG